MHSCLMCLVLESVIESITVLLSQARFASVYDAAGISTSFLTTFQSSRKEWVADMCKIIPADTIPSPAVVFERVVFPYLSTKLGPSLTAGSGGADPKLSASLRSVFSVLSTIGLRCQCGAILLRADSKTDPGFTDTLSLRTDAVPALNHRFFSLVTDPKKDAEKLKCSKGCEAVRTVTTSIAAA